MCKVCIVLGEVSLGYSFPAGHPLSSKRIRSFWDTLESNGVFGDKRFLLKEPILAQEEDILSFHIKEYVEFVKAASKVGEGYLDYGDTPAFKGIFEASSYVVGGTLLGLDHVMAGTTDHAMIPMGGLHHARRDRAGGFCVFNDAALAITAARRKYGIKRILYVDIDAHHGDGVFYEFYDDPEVFIADIHEDGKHLYPGTGFEYEVGEGAAEGTKLNLPLPPGSSDGEFILAFKKVEEFAKTTKPEFIILQCGADGLLGDPLTHLGYSEASHRYATTHLHKIAHEYAKGRLIALGGGGYNLGNVAKAWLEVTMSLAQEPSPS